MQQLEFMLSFSGSTDSCFANGKRRDPRKLPYRARPKQRCTALSWNTTSRLRFYNSMYFNYSLDATGSNLAKWQERTTSRRISSEMQAERKLQQDPKLSLQSDQHLRSSSTALRGT